MGKTVKLKNKLNLIIQIETADNKVTSISSNNNDIQYPSAKAVYELVNGHNYSLDYLTFIATSDGTFEFTGKGTNAISYSIDNGETWSEALNNVIVNVNTGNKVLWKGEMVPIVGTGIGSFGESTAIFNVEGNIMSLFYGDNYQNQIDLSNKTYVFDGLFRNSNCSSAANLILPATILTNYCYRGMFYGCTSLTTPPRLPATTLANYCYYQMFYGCISLTKAPKLPATTLATACYCSMFGGCTSLIEAPELPTVDSMYEDCYSHMFNDCSSLNYIKAMFTLTPGVHLTTSWVSGVAATGVFIKNDLATWDVRGVNGVPTGWNVYTESEYELVRLYQLNNKENTSNKVTSVSSESTDEQYPSAKCVYDLVGNIEDLLSEL